MTMDVLSSALPFRLPFGYAKRHGVLVERRESQWHLYFKGAPTPLVLSEIRRVLGTGYVPEKIEEAAFENKLTELYQRDSSEAQQLMQDLGADDDFFALAEELPESEDLLESEDDAPIIKLINAMLGEAIKEGASDIHIETFEKSLSIRFRVDGVLREVLSPSRKLAPLLVSRIKVMARLDIAEKRVPQDGRISLRIGGRAVDVRVSTMPSSHGERVVLRLLDKNATRLDLHSLGMTGVNRESFNHLIERPHGIILVTGPTGSGKSTTLYAGLQVLNSAERNILTVEDPIEFDIDGIGQTQVNPRVDMTFARGLRAILRQDPDVVMVGKSVTWKPRKLQSGFPDRSPGAFNPAHQHRCRCHYPLAGYGYRTLPDFLFPAWCLAQRLVRTLCPTCRQPYEANAEEKKIFDLSPDEPLTLYRAAGCEECHNKGYRGRTGIHEMLTVDEDVRELIHSEAGEQAIERQIRAHTPSIRDDGLEKVRRGVTTLEEVMRVTREE